MLHGILPVRPLNDTLRDLLDSWDTGQRDRSTEVLSYGLYGEALARWMRHFDTGQLLTLDSRSLSEPVVWEGLEKFLGLDSQPRPHGEAVRANSGVYDPLRLRLLRLRNPLVYDWSKDTRFTYRESPWEYRPIRTAVAVAPTLVDRFVLKRFANSGPEPLTPEVEERLAKFYGGDLDLPVDVTGTDLRGDVPRST